MTTGLTARVVDDVVFAEPDGPLSLDLHLPPDAGTHTPVALYLHGGGWRVGSRKDDVAAYFGPLVDRGIVVVSADYRLSDVASFPAPRQDVAAAAQWLKANAGAYGLDAGTIAIIGASAGGHLGGLYTLGDRTDADPEISSAVLLFPVVDPARWDRETRLREKPAAGTFAALRAPNWPPPRRGALHLGVDDAEAAAELNERASLLAAASKRSTVPFLVLHGDADSAVFHQHSADLHRQFELAGTPSTFLTVAGADHVGPEFSRPEVIGGIGDFIRHNHHNKKTEHDS